MGSPRETKPARSFHAGQRFVRLRHRPISSLKKFALFMMFKTLLQKLENTEYLHAVIARGVNNVFMALSYKPLFTLTRGVHVMSRFRLHLAAG